MLDNLIKKILKEATSDSVSDRGYVGPLQMGIRKFKDSDNGPFIIPVSKYDSPQLEYDSYDGKMDTPKKKIKSIEKKAKKVTNYLKSHPYATFSDDDGNIINATPGRNKDFVPIENSKKNIKEATAGNSKGSYLSPLLPGYREFEKHMNGPFTEYVTDWDDPLLDHDSLDGKMSTNKKTIKKREKRAEKIANYIKNNPDSFAWDGDAGVMNSLPGKNTDAKPIKNFDPKKTVTKLGEWVNLDSETLNEDLAVWFGNKKKPKGSKQPKGPWVNICRKVDGKHPPCGRSNTDKGGYPKCRAAGVAGKMTDSEKRSACQQKRNAEKKDTQTGKGQKPIMTSYKKKKTNEDMKRIVRLTENDVSRIVRKVLKEQDNASNTDFRREKTESLLVRPLYSNDPNIKNTQQFKDLVYGYNKINERIVKARQDSKFDKDEGLDTLVILYNCNDDTLKYANIDRPNINQQNLDETWLKKWCDKINWTSRVRY